MNEFRERVPDWYTEMKARALAARNEPRRLHHRWKKRGECGTDAGYFVHRRDGTKSCQPCLDAHAAKSAENRLRARKKRGSGKNR